MSGEWWSPQRTLEITEINFEIQLMLYFNGLKSSR